MFQRPDLQRCTSLQHKNPGHMLNKGQMSWGFSRKLERDGSVIQSLLDGCQGLAGWLITLLVLLGWRLICRRHSHEASIVYTFCDWAIECSQDYGNTYYSYNYGLRI
jgi:hypothetical protein